jgi:CDP-diacylglycerol--glycerol-3-phosphate 3-phosphatidyltransferase
MRIPLTAIFFVFFYDQPLIEFFPQLRPIPYHHTIALFCFIVACISDWSDGYLARKWKQVTNFGKLWDPVADKILVTAAWVTLVANHAMPAWIVLVLLARDFAVSGLRMLAAQEKVTLAAETGGKIKTIIQLVTIGVLCFHYALIQDYGWNLARPGLHWVELWILYPACLITSIYSAWVYFQKNWQIINVGIQDN